MYLNVTITTVTLYTSDFKTGEERLLLKKKWQLEIVKIIYISSRFLGRNSQMKLSQPGFQLPFGAPAELTRKGLGTRRLCGLTAEKRKK